MDALGGQHRKQNKLVQGKPPQGDSNATRSNNGRNSETHNNPREPTIPTPTATTKRCYICGNIGRLDKQCTKANKKTESVGGAPPTRNNNLPDSERLLVSRQEFTLLPTSDKVTFARELLLL